jgi:signal transduction histidine kinase
MRPPPPSFRRPTAIQVLLAAAAAAWWLAAAGAAVPESTDVSAPEPAHPAAPASPASQIKSMRGVVAFASPDGSYFHILTGGQARGFRLAPPLTLPEFGQDVEVRYDTASQASGGWDALEIRAVGPGTFPAPVSCTPDDVLAGRYNGHWVEVEAVVLQVKYATGFLWIQLAGPNGWGMANVHRWPAGPLGDQWWGARVRLRGLNLGKGQNAFRIHGPELMTVLKPGLAHPFDLPESRVTDVMAAPEPSPERVRLRATVLGSQGGIISLRSGQTALQANLLYPFDSNQEPSGQFLDAPRLPFLNRGDEMDVIGSPLQIQPWIRLHFAQFRVVKRGGTATPRPVSVEEASAGRAANDLVVLRGRLASRHETSAGPLRRETLELTSGPASIPVIFDSPAGGFLKDLSLDDAVEATGIIEPSTGTPPWVLRLAEATEARSLGTAPEVVRTRRWRMAGQASAAVLGATGLLAFGTWRRRRLRQRVNAIRETNAALEQRVTERTAELEVARDELRRALEQERELGELKSRFVTTVSHEFRTPLGITMSAVELLRHYHERLPEDQRRELLDDIHRSTRHMGGLMEQVLVLGRVEAGQAGFRPAPLELASLGQKLADEALSATSHRCPIDWRAETELAGAVGDESLVRHVFSNLLSNAVKYSPADSPVGFTCHREGLEAVFRVIDRGLGIPEADRPHLFEAFHRGTNVGDIPGTGLGLVIVKRCVDLHGGSIDVQDTPGGGTTFLVRLPLWPAGDRA